MNIVEENKSAIVVKAAPFRDSFMSTIGTGVGVVVLAGVPAAFVGGILVYVGWKIWRAAKAWKTSITSGSVHGDIVSKGDELNIGGAEVKILEQPRKIRTRFKSEKKSRIVA